MYSITKLSSKTQALLADISVNNKSRSLPVSLTLARLIANKLPLPSAEVECINNFFNTQHLIDVQARISILNELMLLDVPVVLDLILKFYSFRYNSVFSCDHILLREDAAVLDFFKIRKSFDDATLLAITENAITITMLTTRFIDLLSELQDNLG